MPKPLTLRALFAIGAVLAAVVLLVPAAQAKSRSQLATVKVGTRKVAKLGTILVDSKGRTLYMFVPDKRRKVTCVGTCAKIWPPLKLAAGAKATAGRGVKQSLLGSDKNPAGGRVVTTTSGLCISMSPTLRPERPRDRRSTSTAVSGTSFHRRAR